MKCKKVLKLFAISLLFLLFDCRKEEQNSLKLGLYLSKRDLELTGHLRQELSSWGWRNSFDLVFLNCCEQVDTHEIDFALLVYYIEEFDDSKNQFHKQLEKEVPHLLWLLKPGFFGKPQLPDNLDAVASASAESPSEKALKNLIKPKLEEMAAEIRKKKEYSEEAHNHQAQ